MLARPSAYLVVAGGLAPRRLLASSKPVARTVICSSPATENQDICRRGKGEVARACQYTPPLSPSKLAAVSGFFRASANSEADSCNFAYWGEHALCGQDCGGRTREASSM